MPDTAKHTVHEGDCVIPNSHFKMRKLEEWLALGHLVALRFRLESRLELFCPVLTSQGKEQETQKQKT